MLLMPLFVAIPLLGAFLNSLLGKISNRISDFIGNLVPAILVVLSFFSLFTLKSLNFTPIVYKMGGWVPPFGICFVLDGFSILMLITINIIALTATIFSIPYMEKYTDKWKYYTLFLLMLTAMNGAVLTGDMFNLFVWLEIGAISSYALVAFGTEQEELEASFKYAIMSSSASLFILIGIAFLYSYTSTLNMADIGKILLEKPNSTLVGFVSVLFLLGFGLKSALVPFHSWLPDAHPSAPAPISAMLSGVLIKSLGIYALVRVFFNILGVTNTLLNIFVILGIISMVFGGLLALYQKDLKRLLAYSTISQVGYIIFSFGLGTSFGIFAGLFHLINHAVAKALLFLNSGSLVYSTGERDLEKLGGLKEKMQVTAATSLLGSMSVSGVPPLGGFWSKLLIIISALNAKHFLGATIAILMSIITLAYYLKLQKMTFFGILRQQWLNLKEAPILMCISMIFLAGLCLFLGLILLPGVKDVFLEPATKAIENGVEYSRIIFENIP